jgi:hypothetical protein
MTSHSPRLGMPRNVASYTIFTVGLLLLIGSWIVLYWWAALFTEALLVPWRCCGLETIPSPDTWQRVINDFFANSPGRHLPSILLVAVSAAVLAVRLNRAKRKTWIPMIFLLAHILLFGADLIVTGMSWGLSNLIVGPRVGGIDAGFHRTWYGIAAHFILWTAFFGFWLKRDH